MLLSSLARSLLLLLVLLVRQPCRLLHLCLHALTLLLCTCHCGLRLGLDLARLLSSTQRLQSMLGRLRSRTTLRRCWQQPLRHTVCHPVLVLTQALHPHVCLVHHLTRLKQVTQTSHSCLCLRATLIVLKIPTHKLVIANRTIAIFVQLCHRRVDIHHTQHAHLAKHCFHFIMVQVTTSVHINHKPLLLELLLLRRTIVMIVHLRLVADAG